MLKSSTEPQGCCHRCGMPLHLFLIVLAPLCTLRLYRAPKSQWFFSSPLNQSKTICLFSVTHLIFASVLSMTWSKVRVPNSFSSSSLRSCFSCVDKYECLYKMETCATCHYSLRHLNIRQLSLISLYQP